MDQRELVLSCLGVSEGAPYEPVQIQKLIFIFQDRAKELFPKKLFNFKPYDYGPFDLEVYNTLDALANKGLVDITCFPYGKLRLYKITEKGSTLAQPIIDSIGEPYKSFLFRLSEWVRKVTFAELVGAVYNAYPEMKVNSIFRG